MKRRTIQPFRLIRHDLQLCKQIESERINAKSAESAKSHEAEWEANSFQQRAACTLMPLLLLLRMITFISQVGSWEVIFMMLNLDCVRFSC